MKRVQSTCNFCAIDCNLDFCVEDGRIVRTIPTKGYPVNDGFSCIKGLSLSKQQTTVKPGALPKIRQADGTMKEVSWDEGFKHVADKIKELQAKYGTESVAGISTGQLTLEEFAIFGHVMRNYLQTNVDGNTRLCMASAAVGHKQSFGYDAPGYTLKDLELSDTLIFIGANPVVAHPIIWGRVRKNQVPGHKVIVIDPRRSETAMNADYWYGLKPRTDLVLMSREGGRQELMVSTSLKPAEWSLEGGNETWCKVYWDGSLIRMEVDPYGEQYEYLYPRSCKVSIKSSKLSNVSFTLAQESDTELHTLYYRNQFQLSPSGTPLDIFIFTNFYQWKVKNDSDWFTAEQPDRMTLRVRATPKQEGDTQIRNGSVTLYSAAWAEEDLEYIYWSQIVKLYFSDGDPDLSGEDYEYGDKQDWD